MAKAVAGKINIGVTATTGGLTAGLNTAARKVDGFSAGFGSLKTTLLGLGGAFTAAFSTAKIVGWISSASESIDATAKLSDRLGLATEDLTAYQHAASLAGVSDEKLAAGFSKLQVTLSKAANGIGPAAETLKALDLNPKALLEGGLDSAIKSISDALVGIENPADRARVATELFGKGGMELLPLLMEGSAGLNEMAAEAEMLGLSFDRVDAAQVEAANDAITRAKGVFTGFIQQVAIQLAPMIEVAANKFREFAMSGGNAGERIAAGFDKIVGSVGVLADAFQIVGIVWDGIQAGFLMGLKFIADGLAKVINVAHNLAQLIPGLGDTFQGAAAFANEFSATIGDEAAAAFQKFGEGMDAPWASERIKGLYDDVKEAARVSGEEIAAEAQKGIDGAATSLAALDKPAKKTKAERDVKVAALEQGSSQALSAFLANKRSENDPLTKKTDEVASNTADIARQLRGAPVVRLAAL